MVTMPDTKLELLTLDEAAKRYNVPVATVRSWINRKEVRKFKRGDGRVFVEAREMQAAVERRQQIRPE